MVCRIVKYVILVVGSLLLSMPSFAFDPEVDCPVKIQVDNNILDVENALAENNFGDNSVYLRDEKYIVCFEVTSPLGKIDITRVLNIRGSDKPIIIHGLKFDQGKVWGQPYTGLFISIPGSNITLRNFTIENATTAIQITGSNVEIIDSQIGTKQTGIEIAGTDQAHSQNITLQNTAINGPGPNVAGSIGIKIEHADNVTIEDSLETIRGFETGIYGGAKIISCGKITESPPFEKGG